MKTLFVLITTFSIKVFATPMADTANTEPTYQTCSFEAGDVGKLKFKGNTREEAFERTARACLQARVDTYKKVRGSFPTQERQIAFAEDCVNKTACKH